MAHELSVQIKTAIDAQALEPLEWTVPRLKHLWSVGGRDLKPRSKAEWHALFGNKLSDTACRYLLNSAEADGFLASDGRIRWAFTEMARLSFLDSEVSADEAMPLFVARHKEVYAVNYQYEFDKMEIAQVTEVYHRHNVAQHDLRAKAFVSVRQLAAKASAGDQESFRAMLRGWREHQPIDRPRRRVVADDAAVMEEVAAAGLGTAPGAGAAVVVAAPSMQYLAPFMMVAVPLGMRAEYHHDGRVLILPL